MAPANTTYSDFDDFCLQINTLLLFPIEKRSQFSQLTLDLLSSVLHFTEYRITPFLRIGLRHSLGFQQSLQLQNFDSFFL